MNYGKVIAFQLLRTYATRASSRSVGIRRRKTQSVRLEEDDEVNYEATKFEDGGYPEDDVEDIEVFAKEERKEETSRKLLQYHIVNNKFFKEKEPSFLTFAEKDQIKRLHEKDPDEWTPERLSESFPALPYTIKKVLRSKWNPSSVERIIKYDEKVIENWKNFKTNKLVVDKALEEHLQKFRHRKIRLMDKEALQQFIPAEIKLPEPKSTLFRSILLPIHRDKQIESNDQSTALQTTEKGLISSRDEPKESSVVQIDKYNKVQHEKPNHSGGKKGKKLVLFDFLKKKLDNLDDTSPEEKEVLISTYRDLSESMNSTNVPHTVSADAVKQVTEEEKIAEEKEVSVRENSSNENTLMAKTERQSTLMPKWNPNSSALDTFIKDRVSFMEANLDYTKRIKIPKHAFKEGMTYRINDCYYDDDGEFLYRVPGLRK